MTTEPTLVELKAFRPEAESLILLQALDQAGFTNPMLHGGALRDDYFRNRLSIDIPTNDHDIKAGID
jgi:hypothetical protein